MQEPQPQRLSPEQVSAIENSGLFDFDIEVNFSGYKSSEGDGRTAADIEREREETARGAE